MNDRGRGTFGGAGDGFRVSIEQRLIGGGRDGDRADADRRGRVREKCEHVRTVRSIRAEANRVTVSSRRLVDLYQRHAVGLVDVDDLGGVGAGWESGEEDGVFADV
jgi:hypothetical protein